MSAIPAHTQLIDITVSDGVCMLVLSEAFADCDTSAATAAQAVRQITATLCAFDGIESVHISLLDGSGLNHFDLSRSFSPEDGWIAEE